MCLALDTGSEETNRVRFVRGGAAKRQTGEKQTDGGDASGNGRISDFRIFEFLRVVETTTDARPSEHRAHASRGGCWRAQLAVVAVLRLPRSQLGKARSFRQRIVQKIAESHAV